MSRCALMSFRTMLAFVFFAGFAWTAVAATDARLSESYGKLPLQFEANTGQTDKAVRFLSRGVGYSLYLTASEAVLVLAKPDAKAQESVALRMSLVGAGREPVVTGLDGLPGKANYFVGRDPSKWRTNVPTYAKVHYRNVYRGIDLVYYGNQRHLEYDFVVAPGADPKKIVLGFKGADKLEIDAEGDLVLHVSGRDIRQHKPIIYQEIDGIRQEIAGGYVRKGADRVGFQVATYDTTQPLVIDPVVLAYSTYLGGSGNDQGLGIAVDPDGNAYVTGGTTSTDFPTTAGAFRSGAMGAHMFVTKVDPTGTKLVYSAFLGGNGGAGGSAIAVDAGGNAYVTGATQSTDFPTTAGAFQPAIGGIPNAFVTKLDPTGSALVYSTYLGGSDGFDAATGIAVDADGNAYVSGWTNSTTFPTTPAAFQPVFAGGYDVFVTKLNAAGSALVYSTYIGGTRFDEGHGIAVDAGGNVYVTGSTDSTDLPTTPGAFQPALGLSQGAASQDAFVTKLDPTGSALVYSTYLGGAFTESGSGIAVDANGNAHVAGWTDSHNFPTTPAAFQPSKLSVGVDAFVTKLNPTGSGLVYSTYLGGNGGDTGDGIAVDADGNVYVAGSTDSTDFPTTPGAFQPNFRGGFSDAFVTKLDSAGSVIAYSTYLGGSGDDRDLRIAVDIHRNAYMTGRTKSADFPTTPGSFQPIFGGLAGPRDPDGSFSLSDAFVAKIVDVVLPPPAAPAGSESTPTRSEESAASEIGFWSTYGAETGTFSGGSIVASNVAASTATFSFTGTAVSWIGVKCSVCGIAAVSIDGGAPATVNTAGPNAPGSLTSESVFSASGLAAKSHMITIVVTGMSSSDGTYVAVDAFDVTAGSANSPILPPVVLPPPPIVPVLPPIVGL